MTAGAYESGHTSMPRPRIVVESPFKAPTFEGRAKNLRMALNICRYAVYHGFNPYASHVFFTQFLKDEIVDERLAGITCGLDWSRFAEQVWMVLREGEELSSGMMMALQFHMENRRIIRYFRTADNGQSLYEVFSFGEGTVADNEAQKAAPEAS